MNKPERQSNATGERVMFERPVEPDHPVFPAPDKETAAAVLAEHGAERLAEVIRVRNAAIRAEAADPLNYGFELPTWLLADVLLGFMGWDVFCGRIREIAGVAWDAEVAEDLLEWVEDESLREAVEAGPYQLALLLGGNSAGKTEYMCKRVVGQMDKFDGGQAWVFHENGQQSVDYHQSRVWNYLPERWKRAGKGQVGYVSWKQQTGFSDYKCTGPNGSLISFRNYEQREDTIEGGEVGDRLERRCIGWVADELMPLNWLKTLRFRLNRRQATGVVGFTPKFGYSDVVAWFLDGARVVREERGRALRIPKPMPLVRVGAVDGDVGSAKVIINFHSRYNCYPTRNSYLNLVKLTANDSDATRAIRLYGHAVKSRQDLFPRLSEAAHGFVQKVEG